MPRQAHGEWLPLAGRAFRPHAPPLQVDEMTHDGQTDPHAFILAGGARVHLREWLKEHAPARLVDASRCPRPRL